MPTVISVENLNKSYRLGEISTGTLFRDFERWVARMRGKSDPYAKIGEADHGNRDGEELMALRDVSFTVQQGEVLGIIGRNGAGKSTLLKILSRVTAPTSGQIKVRGRIASLLEVGTGFHPELTGRENIYLNGAILGMTRAEVRRKFDEIVDFAGVERFIDTPVKRYSSGMYVRLAFAVAAHLEPEILIVDEVLAVGDAEFQKKCLGKMGEVAKGGRTVLFVSHQMDMVRALCDRCMLLTRGNIAVTGHTDHVIQRYTEHHQNESSNIFNIEQNTDIPLQVVSGKILNINGVSQSIFDMFEQIIIELTYWVNNPHPASIVNIEVKRNGVTLFLSFDSDTKPELLNARNKGCYTSRLSIPSPLLKSGQYHITINTGIANTSVYQRLDEIMTFEVQLLSKPASVLSYAERRPGIVAVPIDWDTIKIESNKAN